MRVALACDHAGFALKPSIAKIIADMGHDGFVIIGDGGIDVTPEGGLSAEWLGILDSD